jgi:hypothetical protein
VNTKLVAIPYRRAISVTTAPGTRVSSMIHRLVARPATPALNAAQNFSPYQLTLRLALKPHTSSPPVTEQGGSRRRNTLILQRQIEQRRERRKCLDADIRLSCQKPGARVCRPVEHPSRDFKPPICLRPIKRAAEHDKTTLVDGMNTNSATKPGMMPIKKLATNYPVRSQPSCATTQDHTRSSMEDAV